MDEPVTKLDADQSREFRKLLDEPGPLNLLIHEQCATNVVSLRPGDVIVLSFHRRLRPDTRERIRYGMENEFFPGHKCLILEEGITLSVVDPCEIETEIEPDHIGLPRQ